MPLIDCEILKKSYPMQNKLRSIKTELNYQNAPEEIEKIFGVEATSSLSERNFLLIYKF